MQEEASDCVSAGSAVVPTGSCGGASYAVGASAAVQWCQLFGGASCLRVAFWAWGAHCGCSPLLLHVIRWRGATRATGQRSVLRRLVTLDLCFGLEMA